MSTAPVTIASNQPLPTQPASTTEQPSVLDSRESDVLGGRTGTSSTSSLGTSLSWQSVRSSLSPSAKTSATLGWTIALLSVVFTIVALSPTFRSQTMSEKSLQLAEWTALKDYIEECREELAAGLQSQACLKAIKAHLPPPPYVKAGILDKRRRNVWYRRSEQNESDAGPQEQQTGVNTPEVSHWALWLGMLLIIYCAISMYKYFKPRGGRRPVFARQLSAAREEKLHLNRPTPEAEVATTAIRHPPSPIEPSLRRRAVRTHPIYRHANLEEAIHHQDMTEIRLRLTNGEDVNQHWPYLIYKLAICPPSVETPKQLEIARLCLDFGADVNALKGWNGQSALMIAIHFGNLDVAKLLIVNGAMVSYSPPDSNLTALHRCVRLAVTGSATDALEIMELLFQYGANPNQADRADETPLHKLLIDAWLKRDNMGCMKKLAPVAVSLVKYGAYMPRTLKEKYIIGNPVWQVLQTAILRMSGVESVKDAAIEEEASLVEPGPRWFSRSVPGLENVDDVRSTLYD
ncbi:ankyrin [Karstenula rhodostoma CBS 690.94]|uniref:Ankyrin n=1 Tax=Karstenula rhodostoma CBS 690.94 TaxID=1392251 RepID=A0A9P4PFY0_9PLEO|nr:ankyrin [Karstenula rhodostoma CBS 690.94]